MKVILEIKEGASKRRKLWLREHQSLTMGGTQKADVVVVEDAMISGINFSLTCDAWSKALMKAGAVVPRRAVVPGRRPRRGIIACYNRRDGAARD